MQLEQFSPESHAVYRNVPPRIRLNSLGTLTINAMALRLAGWGESVEALLVSYDPERKIIGLKAATLDTPNMIPLRTQNRTKTCGVSAFCRMYGILPTERSINIEVQYNPDLKMLLADHSKLQLSTRKRKEIERANVPTPVQTPSGE